jgi:hypothetical protein
MIKRVFLAGLLLTSCGVQPMAGGQYVDRIEGTVEVLEASADHQYISVQSETDGVAMLVQPPFDWQPGHCYSVVYHDPQTAADGTPLGEPRAVSVSDCGRK